MTILYITEQGATIRHLAGRISVRRDDRIIQELPDFKCRQIVTFGNINLTPELMNYCLQQGIDVAFLSTTGRYKGRLQSELAKNVMLRHKQYECASRPAFEVQNAQAIVTGKIKNMMVMSRVQRRLRDDGRSPASEMQQLLPKIAQTNSLESLNGYEGVASAAYFRAFRSALKGEWESSFQTRQYRPVTDPVNALLSLGYTLLYNNFYAAINIVGLDPFLGVYHRPHHGHAALASDLMEEQRCVVVDPLVMTVLNKRILVASDFVTTPSQEIRLVPPALKKFLALYAEKINEQVTYPQQNIRTTYRQLFEFQVRHFARVILGEEKVYQPFMVVGER